MKSTAQRLAKSYCRPQTEEEWELLSPYFKNEVTFYSNVDSWQKDFEECGHVYFFQHFNGMLSYSKHPIKERTEIPVSHFLDLMHDRIAPWRLEDDGFVFYASTGQHVLHTTGLKRYHVALPPMSNTVKVDVWDGDKGIEADNVSTYTDLITLIRLIG